MLMLDTPKFETPRISSLLAKLGDDDLDRLDFGVIGFDASTLVGRYNAFESQAAGLRPEAVLGLPLFGVVAPCMNNFMVAQRFEDAATSRALLDTVIAYTLTLRMRPVRVHLRLVAEPGHALRYVLVDRRTHDG